MPKATSTSPFSLLAATLMMTAFSAPHGFGAEPPACTDKQILSRVEQAYNGSLMFKDKARSYKSATLKETGVASPPAGVNQYTPSKDHYNKSRYCEAAILLDNGDKDQGYVRIDGLKDPNDKGFNFDLCTVKFDTFKDGCKDNKKP